MGRRGASHPPQRLSVSPLAAHAAFRGLFRIAFKRCHAVSADSRSGQMIENLARQTGCCDGVPPCSPSLDTDESLENPVWQDRCGSAGRRRVCLDSVPTPAAPTPGSRTWELQMRGDRQRHVCEVCWREEMCGCGQTARLQWPGRHAGLLQPQELQAVFNALANVILGARSAGLETGSPVRGLRKVRAARSLLEILPMPGSETDPPSETVSVITEIKPVSTAFVSCCVTPDAAATLATSSPLDIALCDMLTFLY